MFLTTFFNPAARPLPSTPRRVRPLSRRRQVWTEIAQQRANSNEW